MMSVFADKRGSYIVQALVIFAVFGTIALTVAWKLDTSFGDMSSRLQADMSEAQYLENYRNFGDAR